MDTPHETEPEHDLTDEEMTRLERIRDSHRLLTDEEMTRLQRMGEHLRYCGLLVQPDHTVPVTVVITRDDAS